MQLSAGKHRWCACGHPRVHMLPQVHLPASRDLSPSADLNDPLGNKPAARKYSVGAFHFRAVKLLTQGRFSLTIEFIK
jgi:hypothetical protein